MRARRDCDWGAYPRHEGEMVDLCAHGGIATSRVGPSPTARPVDLCAHGGIATGNTAGGRRSRRVDLCAHGGIATFGSSMSARGDPLTYARTEGLRLVIAVGVGGDFR